MTRVRFASNDPIRVTKSWLKYGHVFCYQCLVNWFRIIKQCPTCKTKYRCFHDESIISPENGKFDYVYSFRLMSILLFLILASDIDDCYCLCCLRIIYVPVMGVNRSGEIFCHTNLKVKMWRTVKVIKKYCKIQFKISSLFLDLSLFLLRLSNKIQGIFKIEERILPYLANNVEFELKLKTSSSAPWRSESQFRILEKCQWIICKSHINTIF